MWKKLRGDLCENPIQVVYFILYISVSQLLP